MKEILASPISSTTIQRGKWNKNFLHFQTYLISSKYGKKWRKSLFNLSSTHYYSTKEHRKTQIQVILALLFFHYHFMCDFTKKVRWQRRITTVNDKIDAFLFHHFYFQKMDRKKNNQATLLALLITLWYFFNTKSYSQAALKQLFPQSLFKTHMFLTTNCL